MTNETHTPRQDVKGMAMFCAVEFEVLGKLTHEQRRIVRAWLREVDALGECGAQARTAKNCRASKWTVHRAIRRFKRIIKKLGEGADQCLTDTSDS